MDKEALLKLLDASLKAGIVAKRVEDDHHNALVDFYNAKAAYKRAELDYIEEQSR